MLDCGSCLRPVEGAGFCVLGLVVCRASWVHGSPVAPLHFLAHLLSLVAHGWTLPLQANSTDHRGKAYLVQRRWLL
jgi:hypothetical protein